MRNMQYADRTSQHSDFVTEALLVTPRPSWSARKPVSLVDLPHHGWEKGIHIPKHKYNALYPYS